MIRFDDVEFDQCRTPLAAFHDPSGPDMPVCGKAAVPGRTYCAECRPRLYYRPSKTELHMMDRVVGKPLRPIERR